mmetsp:Transcript_9996/g.25884  ORF Transcript_9996/g.25884 Transcript_9996/m.25884 type:complete len:530 (-) Transcript_9996:184-1773(-)
MPLRSLACRRLGSTRRALGRRFGGRFGDLGGFVCGELLSECDGVLAAVVEPDGFILDDALVHRHEEIGPLVHLVNVRHRIGHLPQLEGAIAELRGTQSGVRLVVPDAADHQLGYGVEGELGWLAGQHVRHAREHVRRRHRRKVVLEREQRHGRLWRATLAELLGEVVHAVHGIDDVVRSGAERLDERDAHVLVVTRVEEELDLARCDALFERRHEVGNKRFLGTGSTNGDEDAARLARLGAGDARGAVGLDAIDHVLGDPRAGDAQPIGGDSHAQQVVIVTRTLDQVVSTRDDDEPLGVVVDDEIDHFGEAERDSCETDEAVRRDDRRVLGQTQEDRPQVLRHLVRDAQSRLVTSLGERPPELLHRAAEFGGHPRTLGVEGVHVLDQSRLGRVDVEQVVKVRCAARGNSPRRSSICDAVVAKAHADRAHDERAILARVWREWHRAITRPQRRGHHQAFDERRLRLREWHSHLRHLAAAHVELVEEDTLGPDKERWIGLTHVRVNIERVVLDHAIVARSENDHITTNQDS